MAMQASSCKNALPFVVLEPKDVFNLPLSECFLIIHIGTKLSFTQGHVKTAVNWDVELLESEDALALACSEKLKVR